MTEINTNYRTYDYDPDVNIITNNDQLLERISSVKIDDSSIKSTIYKSTSCIKHAICDTNRHIECAKNQIITTIDNTHCCEDVTTEPYLCSGWCQDNSYMFEDETYDDASNFSDLNKQVKNKNFK